jgi:hypothetical protein
MKINKLFSLLVILALLMAAMPIMTAGAASTVIVKPSFTSGWRILPTGDVAVTTNNATGKIVAGPGGQPGGLLPGSVEFKTMSVPGGKPQLYAPDSLAGVKFTDLTALSYSTYISHYASGTHLVHTINVKIDLDGDLIGTTTDRYTMVFEPCYTISCAGPIQPLNTWATWDALAPGAIWWSTGSIAGTAFITPFGSFAPLASIYTTYPNAVISFLLFQAGQGSGGLPWNDFVGNLDGVVIGINGDNTTYDFEPTPPDTAGPVTSNLLVSPNPATINSSVTVTANVDDTITGGSNIASAEYSLDNGFTWSPMSAAASAFDEVSEDVTTSFNASATPGIYDLCVRGTDVAGNVGERECIMFVVYDPTGGFVTGGGWIDSPVGAVAPVENAVFFNGFETDINGWSTPTRVMSGYNNIPSASGSYHAEMTDDYTFWGGANSVFPMGGYVTSIDVYLNVDAGYSNDTRFDWTSAIGTPTNTHRRDFVFSGGFYDDATGPAADQNRFIFSASNNTPGWPKNPGRDPFAVTTTGWYTLQHRFYDSGAGVLAVDLSILDSAGNVLHKWTLSDPTDVIGTTVGGNQYGWFATNGFPFLAIDNSMRKEFSFITGKATFGFVSKYKKGATVPDGNTEFKFVAGDLNFSSTSYEWLVVNQAGANAQFKGTGTINGTGDYDFMLWAGDGSPDTFRIKIWDAATEVLVYDNGTNQPIGGGSIVVHKK